MSPPRVLIIGCGIAGPVVALLLQRKGYSPIVLEKVRELGDAGSSLMLMPNGLKVLSLLALSSFATESTPNLACLRDISSEGTELGGSELPATWKEKYGQPACGVKRTALNLALKDKCLAADIPVLEGWNLQNLIESKDGVTAIAKDGRQEKGLFLIGCDGIRSVTRSLVRRSHGINEEEATFTGLTQTAGTSAIPESWNSKPGMINWYGPSAHFITFPVFPSTTTSWAITQRSSIEEVETWQQMSSDELAAYKQKLAEQFKDWCEPIPELIEGATRIIKYGLYDRPQLEPTQWVSEQGRCVLIGDAAHPTSPHLGQGANQALEDCYHLAKLLPDFVGDTAILLDAENLKIVFLEFAEKRQPRTAAMVKGARAQGERRVVDGEEACKARDEALRSGWKDVKGVEDKWEGLLKEPF
ncbi:monooxygenase FAD-binding protein [Acephala macrosclerotiorum]|nr:monooxygenase FAD-binding protein [Acephala macrosclerotiorum]